MKCTTSLHRLARIPLVFVFAALFLAPAAVFSLDISVGGTVLRSLSEARFAELSYPVPRRGTLEKGLTVLEAAPLMAEIYRMEITDDGGRVQVLTGDLTDAPAGWYLFREDGGWTLEAEGRVFSRVTSLDLSGELLESGELTVWISWEGTGLLESEIERFKELSGFEVDVLEVPSILSKLTSVVRGGGAVPDLVMVQSDYLPELIAGRIIQRLDYIPMDHVVDKGRSAFSRDGGQWAAPYYFDTQLVFFRPDITGSLPEGGWSLDQFVAILSSVHARGTSPITWNAFSAYWLIPFQIAFGKANLLEPDGGIVIDDAATRRALEYLVYLSEEGLLDVREREGMISRFVEGDVAMILTGSYSIPAFEELGLDFAVHPYPYNAETGKPVSSLLDFKGWAITRKTHNPILARRLMEYLTGTGSQYRFTAGAFKLPANAEAWKSVGRENPYFPVLEESYRNGTVIPPNEDYPIFKNTMWKLLRFVFTGQMSIEAVLEQGQAIIDQKIQRRKR